MKHNGHFDFLAPFYDRVIHYADAQSMISLAGLPVSGRLLDAGGGTGRVAESLKGYADQVIVADLSYPMLQRAAGKELATSCAEIETLPYRDSSFERVIMVDALHHVADQRATARELWRVLAPGGRLVVVEPDIGCFAVKLIALFEKMALMRSHFLSASRMRELFSYPDSSSRITLQNCNAWVIMDKKSG
jgi:demethylmenaquinone methyltransferase/2-methoxy-6-polyprenyl-1,4-benzoquinol methylase